MAIDWISAPASWMNPDQHHHIALTEQWYKNLLELQDELNFATVAFWRKRQVRSMPSPVTTNAVSSPMGLGSDSIPVRVDLFGRKVYLADSLQFLLEYGCRLSANGTYYIAPSFRGEEPDQMHLNQFFHSEAEVAGSLDDCLATVENYLNHLCAALLKSQETAISATAKTTEHVEKLISRTQFPRVSMAEARRILCDNPNFVQQIAPAAFSLTRAGERRLIEHFGGVVWVTEPDHLSVPFYQGFLSSNRNLATAADLLLGYGETVGAGERHADHESLAEALELHQVDRAAYQWYYAMKQQYPMQTSGFGMGVERFLMWLLQHDDIRDMSLALRMKDVETNP